MSPIGHISFHFMISNIRRNIPTNVEDNIGAYSCSLSYAKLVKVQNQDLRSD